MLDRQRFAYHFEHGSKESVLATLRAYQNADGGFGHALEPDIRCPQSQPIPTELALTIMDELQAFDEAILSGIIKYLAKITVPGTGGFPRALRSLISYPHAPWWTTEDDSRASLNPTGRIIALLWKQKAVPAVSQERWFQLSRQFVWEQLDRFETTDYHELIQVISFLKQTPEQDKARPYLAKLDELLHQPGVIEKDPHATGYVQKVLDWVPAKDSFCRKYVTDSELKEHLQALLAQQQEDGGWPISWMAISPGAEMEWRGFMTVERLKTLRSFGWI